MGMMNEDGEPHSPSLTHQEHGDRGSWELPSKSHQGAGRGGADCGDKKVLERLGCRAGSVHQSCWLASQHLGAVFPDAFAVGWSHMTTSGQ